MQVHKYLTMILGDPYYSMDLNEHGISELKLELLPMKIGTGSAFYFVPFAYS